jgi:hypothetical protein
VFPVAMPIVAARDGVMVMLTRNAPSQRPGPQATAQEQQRRYRNSGRRPHGRRAAMDKCELEAQFAGKKVNRGQAGDLADEERNFPARLQRVRRNPGG